MSLRQRESVLLGCLWLAALIHLLPLAGVSGGSRLQALYGLAPIIDPGVDLLLRHRAVLFGVLGMGLVIASLRPDWRLPSIALVLLSDLAFLGLAWSTPTLPPALTRVVHFDLVAVVALGLALLCRTPDPLVRGPRGA